MRIAFAGGTLAALVFAVIVLNGWNSNEEDVAAATVPAVKVDEASQVAIPALEESPTIVKTESDKTGGSVREYRNVHPTRQFRATEAKAWSIRKPQNVRVTNASSTPRLGNFVETEDTSLRLADLVADIDTKDLN